MINYNDYSTTSIASSGEYHPQHSRNKTCNNNAVHVVGCNVWSDYAADVIFDDGTALCFGAGLDCFVRASRFPTTSVHHQRLAIDLQHHYTSHALSKDLPHVGAALKVISTISPRCKFLRVAVNATTNSLSSSKTNHSNSSCNNHPDDDDIQSAATADAGGIMFWKSQTVSLEEYVAPPHDDPRNVIVNPDDSSVTVVAIGGNASLWLSPNGAFFDVTWACRAFESDGRSIQFVPSETAPATINSRGVNTVKAVLCVPHQQRFPVGLAVDAFRKFPRAPEYRHESVTDVDFFAPLACWAPLLRVALRVWREQLGGVCPASVVQFLEVTSDDAARLKELNPKAAAILNRAFSCEDQVTSNFPPPIPPKVIPVVSPFPKLSIEDAATLLASTSDRLHSLPIHNRLHGGACLCVSWSSGDRCSWASPEAGYARSLIFEDMSCLHIEGLAEHAPMALLHIQNAVSLSTTIGSSSNSSCNNRRKVEQDEQHDQFEQQDKNDDRIRSHHQYHRSPTENESASLDAVTARAPLFSLDDDDNDNEEQLQQLQQQQHERKTRKPTTPSSSPKPQLLFESSSANRAIVAAARVYSWATGSLEATSRHAPLLPACVVIPANYISCASTMPFFALFAARVGSSDVDPRRGRYLHTEVEFIASFLQVAKQSKSRAALHAPAFAVALSRGALLDSSSFTDNNNYYSCRHQSNQNDALNKSTAASSSSCYSEGVGAVRCSSTIPHVGHFTAYQDGTCRCCFDDRTILTLKVESVNPTKERLPNLPPGSSILAIEEIFVTALDNRAVSTRFRAASCNPQHAMYNYLQYALPFMRYASLPPEDRAQLCSQADALAFSSMATGVASASSGFGQNFRPPGGDSDVTLATQVERVIARSQLTLMRHNESSIKRQELLDEY